MLEILKAGGPLSLVLVAIGALVIVLTLRLVLRLARGELPSGRCGEASLQALPFWGVIALLTGLLGQAAGLYKGLMLVARLGMVDPSDPIPVLIGLRESFVTTLMGLAICTGALLLWGGLMAWHHVSTGRDRAEVGTAISQVPAE